MSEPEVRSIDDGSTFRTLREMLERKKKAPFAKWSPSGVDIGKTHMEQQDDERVYRELWSYT